MHAGGFNAGAMHAGSSLGGSNGSAGAPGKAGAASGGKSSGGSAGSASGGKSAGGSAGTASGGKGAGGATSTGGGGSSAAGATSTGSGGSSTVAGFSVQYKYLNNSATGAYITCEIVATNAGPNSLAVAGLKVRYYFTDEPKKTNSFQNNFQHINLPGNQANLKVTQTVAGMAPTAPTADTYIEFTFSSSDHQTLAPGEALDFAWQMQSADTSKDNFTQTNDYSFDGSKASLADWKHIVLFQGNNPLWGDTP